MLVKFPSFPFATCILHLQLLLQGSFHQKEFKQPHCRDTQRPKIMNFGASWGTRSPASCHSFLFARTVLPLGDSMSKVQEKRSMSKSGFFWWNVKDNKANWWFLSFFEQHLWFCGVFSQKSKIPKNYCFEKVKIEEIFFVCFFNIKQLISSIKTSYQIKSPDQCP